MSVIVGNLLCHIGNFSAAGGGNSRPDFPPFTSHSLHSFFILDDCVFVRIAMTSMEDLLSRHCLAERLRYETASTTTNVVSVSVVDKTGPCQLVHSPALSSRLHETLKKATDWIFPRGDDDHDGHHDASDVANLAKHLQDTSVWAEDAALTQLVSGEMGESHFLMAYLVLPLNNLLRLMFSATGLIVYWRFVGIGPGGKPDIELICHRRQEGTTEKLAVCEIKTIDALTNRYMNQLLSDIRDGRLSMDGQHAFYEQGKATVPRAQRSKSCKIAQQVSRPSLFSDIL